MVLQGRSTLDMENAVGRTAGDEEGEYVISTDKHNFINAGIMEARHSTDHQIVLSVLLR